MSTYNIIAASNENTVVAEYTPESSRSDSFQSEAALEKEFIRLRRCRSHLPLKGKAWIAALSVSLRLGPAAGLICHRHIIHYRSARFARP